MPAPKSGKNYNNSSRRSYECPPPCYGVSYSLQRMGGADFRHIAEQSSPLRRGGTKCRGGLTPTAPHRAPRKQSLRGWILGAGGVARSATGGGDK